MTRRNGKPAPLWAGLLILALFAVLLVWGGPHAPP